MAGRCRLPQLALDIIFSKLAAEDLCSSMQVCLKWGRTASEPRYWKALCEDKWPSLTKSYLPGRSYYQLYKAGSKVFQNEENIKSTPLCTMAPLESLVFFIDVTGPDGTTFFSEVIEGQEFVSVLPGMGSQFQFHQARVRFPPTEADSELHAYFEDDGVYKLATSFKERKVLPLEDALELRVSLMVSRRDNRRVTCIANTTLQEKDTMGRLIRQITFESTNQTHAASSSEAPFYGEICLLTMMHVDDESGADDESDEKLVVFGFELNLKEVYTKEEFLQLLGKLEWY